ncbi:MAG: hypothetical protein IKB23_03670, partial [Clostridia bacterium]|nr:hypothetical protein [Clostridia bacterium]
SYKESENVFVCDNMYKAISGASVIILPLPASSDGTTLNCVIENAETKVQLTSIVDAIDSDCIIIGGKLPKAFTDYAELNGIKTFDYFELESFQIKNAYTTAEAALNVAMNSLRKNIKDSKFAITGYGRISKQLAKLLLKFDAEVTVAARKESDLTWAELEGAQTLKLPQKVGTSNTIESLCHGYDVIFNTVPHWLFDESFLRKVDRDTLIIELASAPGGIDISEAKRLKSNVLWAASLPGKYAPQSAGKMISDCVIEIIEREVSE